MLLVDKESLDWAKGVISEPNISKMEEMRNS